MSTSTSPLFQRLALPIPSGNTKIPGIKIQDTRMLRLMEVLLHRGTQLGGWRSRQIHEAILSAFQLTPEKYTLTQLRYDLRKLKAHTLLERDGSRYAYRLTEKGIRAPVMFTLFHQRVSKRRKVENFSYMRSTAFLAQARSTEWPWSILS